MTYQTATISPDQLSKVKIHNQQKILELTGSELDPIKAWEVIKAESNGFADKNDKAEEADKLLMELLKKNNAVQNRDNKPKISNDKESSLRLKERERLRLLELLELELELQIKNLK